MNLIIILILILIGLIYYSTRYENYNTGSTLPTIYDHGTDTTHIKCKKNRCYELNSLVNENYLKNAVLY